MLKIIAVGKLKEKYWQDAYNEYEKRLGKYTKIETIEINEEKLVVENESNIEITKTKEGERILKKIQDNDFVILFYVQGKMYDSVMFANKLEKYFVNGNSNICYVLGGSYGFSKEVYARANELVSISKMTFPHQFARVMAVEQIYRAYKINNHEKYHK